MRTDVALDLKASAAAFVGLVWPVVCPMIQRGRMIPCEATDDDLRTTLDIYAGIDGWQVLEADGRMRGIASRVQPIEAGATPWNTFTIRLSRDSGAETEFRKRCAAIDRAAEGWLIPHLTIHAYVDAAAAVLLSAAVVRTKDLFFYARVHQLDENSSTVYTRRTNNASFLVVGWKNLVRDGVRVKIVEPVRGACS